MDNKRAKGGTKMEINEFFWNCFQETGLIGCYLLSKQLENESDYTIDNGVEQEEQD